MARTRFLGRRLGPGLCFRKSRLGSADLFPSKASEPRGPFARKGRFMGHGLLQRQGISQPEQWKYQMSPVLRVPFEGSYMRIMVPETRSELALEGPTPRT